MPEQRRQFEVDEDMEFQRRDWAFERAGWFGLLLVLVAAGTGLMGNGPLSDAEAASPDRALVAEYSRFERHGASATLTVLVARQGASDSTVRVWLGNEYMKGILLEQVVPEPNSQLSSASRMTYEIPLAPEADTARVTFHFRPETIGARRLVLGSASHQLALSQFVYP
jgi:hypothetical protein